jgi:hypothetical protein
MILNINAVHARNLALNEAISQYVNFILEQVIKAQQGCTGIALLFL